MIHDVSSTFGLWQLLLLQGIGAPFRVALAHRPARRRPAPRIAAGAAATAVGERRDLVTGLRAAQGIVRP